MPRRTDSRPLHQQVAASIRAQIMAGEIPVGSQLPSTGQLVDSYGASNPTIQKALALLKDEGFLWSHPGKGVYVRERESLVVEVGSYFAPSQRKYSYQLVEVSEVDPPAEIATALGTPLGEKVVMRHRLMSHDGEAMEISWSYYPTGIAAGTPLASRGKIRGGAPQALADLGYPQREFTDQLSVRQPTSEEVESLDLPSEVPVIRQFRIIYSDDDLPVEATVMVKGGHQYELLYRQAVGPVQ